METPIRYFNWDFELSLTESFKTIWKDFPCVNPLAPCQWVDYGNGSIGIKDYDEEI